jgi:hypothetical protein
MQSVLLMLCGSLILSGYSRAEKEPVPRRLPTIPKYCVQPVDKAGRIKPERDRPSTEVRPHCPNPELVKPTPSKRRRIEK